MKKLKYIFIYVYITILLTFGFWVNFTPIPLVLDCAAIPLLFYLLLYSDGIKLNEKQTRLQWELIIYFVGLSLILIKDLLRGTLLPRVCILGYRDYAEFMIVGLIMNQLVSTKKDISNILKYITFLSALLCLFGVSQYIFYDHLPDSLLRVRSGETGFVFGLDELLYRPTALFENGIVFNGIIIISSGLSFAFIMVEGFKLKYIICFLVAVIANITTCSRASIAGSVPLYFLEFFLLRKTRFDLKSVLIVLLFITALFTFFVLSKETAVYKRMFDSSLTEQSNSTHFETISEAIDTIGNHIVLGIGLGTQGYDSSGSTVEKIIRDGCIFQFALETGLPLTILFIIVLLTISSNSYRVMKRTNDPIIKVLCGSFVSITGYFIFSNFINSAYNAKEVFGLYWIMAGLTLWKGIDDPEDAYKELPQEVLIQEQNPIS